MSDYFQELGHEPLGDDPNAGPSAEKESLEMKHIRMLAILNGIDLEIEVPEASKNAIKRLKEHKMTKDDQIECAICKKVSEVDEVYKILPCSHEFHEECILLWLKKANSCPLCRYELETDDPCYEEVKRFRQQETQRQERLDGLLDSMFT